MSGIIWLTGPPAAGKTTLAHAFLKSAAKEGARAVHLESDAMRRILTPQPTYRPEERDRFYSELADLAALLAGQGFPVLVDATAPRRAHRDRARRQIDRFLEVHVDAPPEIRESRDTKGIYRLAREGKAPDVPGATSPYESPLDPDLVVSGTAPAAQSAAELVALARRKGML